MKAGSPNIPLSFAVGAPANSSGSPRGGGGAIGTLGAVGTGAGAFFATGAQQASANGKITKVARRRLANMALVP